MSGEARAQLHTGLHAHPCAARQRQCTRPPGPCSLSTQHFLTIHQDALRKPIIFLGRLEEGAV